MLDDRVSTSKSGMVCSVTEEEPAMYGRQEEMHSVVAGAGEVTTSAEGGKNLCLQ